jgi:hypothetical protein
MQTLDQQQASQAAAIQLQRQECRPAETDLRDILLALEMRTEIGTLLECPMLLDRFPCLVTLEALLAKLIPA